MPDVYVAAGSNIEPGPRLRQALEILTGEYGALKVSPAYRNSPVGFAGEDFVNLAFGFTTGDSARQVVERLHDAEIRCGRPRHASKWAARAMDLDIVLYGDLICDEPNLVLPRPDLIRRPYMLKPLADIAPDVVHPTAGKRLKDLWAAFDGKAHPLVPVDLAVV